ncbi:PAS domain S-box protein [Subsaximicrobium wynnwilliamsii]|uniref:histidine kinase n=1 Tax=Subsaximicrobium wynnwilliamsii TaxID=291179 RepID=A0A5C6ZKS3_9FLAO|nr:chemotaxis protein CheB [Subsaximicrobium wynnwilliamsii]TXD85578.1 PAS domain S-box protein [Subsaximicrobium wynnwilliamsii]TXD90931.1 PAS domain S-box protein [Subsaximicrobium wynnwilliamsii]TXE05438.1 PAS domain S-box protein [Subsaximicrobium wynnwilliamsii]
MSQKENKQEESLEKSKNKFPVVGVGASAGGLAAFKKLLSAIPEDSGMAYVLVQHLDPNHDSLLPELLQKATKIPVLEITDDIKVAPNNIYIIPSNKMLLATEGVLKLNPRPAPKSNNINLPINLFFNSLALVHQSHSLGVVLTGTGSDGTAGLEAIKEQGGMTFAQDEASAEWKDMPRNAIDAGVVDFILPPENIPKKIIAMLAKLDKDGQEKDPVSEPDEQAFRQILSLLRTRKGTDFTYYKQTTIHRRILRRMGINKNKKPSNYLDYLRDNTEEQDLLYQDLLIPVTSFFRDSDIFEKLCESILPKIAQNNKDNSTIRLWVAGCSTGQEAYSLAMCIKEYLNAHPELYKTSGASSKEKIQIFASDISEPAVAIARKGVYTKDEVDGVSSERLKKFFSKYNGGYQINKELRELCVFAVHNFLKDPPFGSMDLISCRNVLIYFQPYLQKRALTTFHYALKAKSYLLLGKSETTGSTSDHFTAVSKSDKLFLRNDVHGKLMFPYSQQHDQTLHKGKNRTTAIENRRTDFQKTADELLLSNYTPASVVVDESMDIVLFRGNTGDYLGQKGGAPSHNLMKMAKGGLAFELRNILHKVKKSNASEKKEEIPFHINDNRQLIAIEAVPLPNMEESHYLILFYPPLAPASSTSGGKRDKKDEKDLRIEQLENELVQSREDMRAISEDQEAANEELQSANEELLSSGEELQSLNEELETSKEELQSTNEEITAVNQELIGLNEQVTDERNFAEGIIMTVREPLVVLDKNLKVITANESFYKTFKVNETDTEGSLIYELGNKQWNIPALRNLLESILPEAESFFDFEMIHTFESIGERTMLLNARKIKGERESRKMILLAIEDITEKKRLLQREQELLEKFKNLVMQAPVAIMLLSGEDYQVELANDSYLSLVEKDKHLIGKSIFESLPELKTQGIKALFDEVVKSGEPYFGKEVEVKINRNTKSKRGFYNFVYQPMNDGDPAATGIMVIAMEVTEQVLARKKISETVHKYNEMIYSSPSLMAILEGEDLTLTVANDAFLDQLGKGRGVIGKRFLDSAPELEEQGLGDLLREVYKTGKPYHAHERRVILVRDGKRKLSYYNFVFQPQRDIQGNVVGVAIIASEFTAQAEFNKEIRESEARYHQMTELVPDMISNATAAGEVFYYNKAWTDFTGWDMKKLIEQGWEKLIHPEELPTVEQNWNSALKAENAFEMEFRILDRNGDYKWHITRSIPVKDENGNILTWLAANTEIHKLKEEEKRKEGFLKMVSHELKTPITSIKGYTQLLLSFLEDDTDIQWESLPIKPSLQRIDSQITRLTRLISEMLDLDRLEDNQLLLQNEVFNLNELVEATIKDIEYAHKQTNIRLKIESACQVHADRDRIGQVLINFITNAIKYSPNDQNVEIKVFQTNDKTVSVSVKDHGIGIEKKDQQNIFKRFYRVSGKNEETFAGFGIGLYLAKEMIERHKGRVKVKSKKGEGSEFIFTLPVHTKTNEKKE